MRTADAASGDVAMKSITKSITINVPIEVIARDMGELGKVTKTDKLMSDLVPTDGDAPIKILELDMPNRIVYEFAYAKLEADLDRVGDSTTITLRLYYGFGARTQAITGLIAVLSALEAFEEGYLAGVKATISQHP